MITSLILTYTCLQSSTLQSQSLSNRYSLHSMCALNYIDIIIIENMA